MVEASGRTGGTGDRMNSGRIAFRLLYPMNIVSHLWQDALIHRTHPEKTPCSDETHKDSKISSRKPVCNHKADPLNSAE